MVLGGAESDKVSHWRCDIVDSLEAGNSDEVVAQTKVKVLEVCQRFPVYG